MKRIVATLVFSICLFSQSGIAGNGTIMRVGGETFQSNSGKTIKSVSPNSFDLIKANKNKNISIEIDLDELRNLKVVNPQMVVGEDNQGNKVLVIPAPAQ